MIKDVHPSMDDDRNTSTVKHPSVATALDSNLHIMCVIVQISQNVLILIFLILIKIDLNVVYFRVILCFLK